MKQDTVKNYNVDENGKVVVTPKSGAGGGGKVSELPAIPKEDGEPVRPFSVQVTYYALISVAILVIVASVILTAVYCYVNRGESYVVNRK